MIPAAPSAGANYPPPPRAVATHRRRAVAVTHRRRGGGTAAATGRIPAAAAGWRLPGPPPQGGPQGYPPPLGPPGPASAEGGLHPVGHPRAGVAHRQHSGAHPAGHRLRRRLRHRRQPTASRRQRLRLRRSTARRILGDRLRSCCPGLLASAGLLVWNWGYRQGTTGPSIGKSVMKFKVVSEKTWQPIGFGLSIVRQLRTSSTRLSATSATVPAVGCEAADARRQDHDHGLRAAGVQELNPQPLPPHRSSTAPQ